ncbi:hypothetical protein VPH35_131604 [Triticum aestivum]
MASHLPERCLHAPIAGSFTRDHAAAHVLPRQASGLSLAFLRPWLWSLLPRAPLPSRSLCPAAVPPTPTPATLALSSPLPDCGTGQSCCLPPSAAPHPRGAGNPTAIPRNPKRARRPPPPRRLGPPRLTRRTGRPRASPSSRRTCGLGSPAASAPASSPLCRPRPRSATSCPPCSPTPATTPQPVPGLGRCGLPLRRITTSLLLWRGRRRQAAVRAGSWRTAMDKD